MASTSTPAPDTSLPSTNAPQIPTPPDTETFHLELSDLQTQTSSAQQPQQQQQTSSTSGETNPATTTTQSQSSAPAQSSQNPSTMTTSQPPEANAPTAAAPTTTSAPVASDIQDRSTEQPQTQLAQTTTNPPLNRTETEAIGPSSDTPTIKSDPTAGPTVIITLLLTNGARHPYKIDEKYLAKRNVKPEGGDPYSISVYTLKELILTDWRSEWEPKPSNASLIRLIHMGKMLDDKQKLSEAKLGQSSPNVIHMSIKPSEPEDAEETGKTGKGSGRYGDEERTAGCRCVIL